MQPNETKEIKLMILPDKIDSLCFTGHRSVSSAEEHAIVTELCRILPILIAKHGLQSCYAGGAVGLDTIAALSVLKVRDSYPSLRLNLILPCAGQENTWNDEQKRLYNYIKERANSVRVLSPVFYNGCMQVRNRELIAASKLCIAYLRAGTSEGGSLNAVLQAARHGIPIINLANKESEDIR